MKTELFIRISSKLGNETILVKGTPVSGDPKTIWVSCNEIAHALGHTVSSVIGEIKSALYDYYTGLMIAPCHRNEIETTYNIFKESLGAIRNNERKYLKLMDDLKNAVGNKYGKKIN